MVSLKGSYWHGVALEESKGKLGEVPEVLSFFTADLQVNGSTGSLPCVA